MNTSALRALEFERIAEVVTGLAITPPGRARLIGMHPATNEATVIATQRATSEGTRFLSGHPGFPLIAERPAHAPMLGSRNSRCNRPIAPTLHNRVNGGGACTAADSNWPWCSCWPR